MTWKLIQENNFLPNPLQVLSHQNNEHQGSQCNSVTTPRHRKERNCRYVDLSQKSEDFSEICGFHRFQGFHRFANFEDFKKFKDLRVNPQTYIDLTGNLGFHESNRQKTYLSKLSTFKQSEQQRERWIDRKI